MCAPCHANRREYCCFHTNELILLTVGRLGPQKGHHNHIRYLENCEKAPCRFVICGVGEPAESLKKLADDLKIADSILFTDWSDNPYKYMKQADIFIISSMYEGQPNVLIEALICGCLIVSVDCDYGGVLENGMYGVLTKKKTLKY